VNAIIEAGIKDNAIEKMIAEIKPSATPSIYSIFFVFLNMATVTSISNYFLPNAYLIKAVLTLFMKIGRASLLIVDISKK